MNFTNHMSIGSVVFVNKNKNNLNNVCDLKLKKKMNMHTIKHSTTSHRFYTLLLNKKND